jgi:hypothetical protein
MDTDILRAIFKTAVPTHLKKLMAIINIIDKSKEIVA